MPFEKGKSGNPGGRPKGKPFRDALMMEIAAAGEDHKALRKIAAALIAKAALVMCQPSTRLLIALTAKSHRR